MMVNEYGIYHQETRSINSNLPEKVISVSFSPKEETFRNYILQLNNDRAVIPQRTP